MGIFIRTMRVCLPHPIHPIRIAEYFDHVRVQPPIRTLTMPELAEEQESAQPDFERYLDIARRRHLHFLIPVFLGWLTVWGMSWVLPTKYKSSTLILVEQPTMPENYVAPNVNENLQARLQSITQQILSRTRLLIIIDKLNLYPARQLQRAPDDKVEMMRKDISIDMVRRHAETTRSLVQDQLFGA